MVLPSHRPYLGSQGMAGGLGGRGCLGTTPGTSPRGAGRNKTTKRNYNPPSTTETLVSMTRNNKKIEISLPLHDMLQKDEKKKIFLKELYFSYTIFIIIIIISII